MNGIGNENTLTIHVPDCKYVIKINEYNIVDFEEIYHATGMGYDECNYCLGRGLRRYIKEKE